MAWLQRSGMPQNVLKGERVWDLKPTA